MRLRLVGRARHAPRQGAHDGGRCQDHAHHRPHSRQRTDVSRPRNNAACRA
jgi:hypothetical protein